MKYLRDFANKEKVLRKTLFGQQNTVASFLYYLGFSIQIYQTPFHFKALVIHTETKFTNSNLITQKIAF